MVQSSQSTVYSEETMCTADWSPKILNFISIGRVREENESPPNKQCSILSDRHWGEPSRKDQLFSIALCFTHNCVFYLTVATYLPGPEAQCNRNQLVLSLWLPAKVMKLATVVWSDDPCNEAIISLLGFNKIYHTRIFAWLPFMWHQKAKAAGLGALSFHFIA